MHKRWTMEIGFHKGQILGRISDILLLHAIRRSCYQQLVSILRDIYHNYKRFIDRHVAEIFWERDRLTVLEWRRKAARQIIPTRRRYFAFAETKEQSKTRSSSTRAGDL